MDGNVTAGMSKIGRREEYQCKVPLASQRPACPAFPGNRCISVLCLQTPGPCRVAARPGGSSRHGEGLAWHRGRPPWLGDCHASGLIDAFPAALSEREEIVLNVLLTAS